MRNILLAFACVFALFSCEKNPKVEVQIRRFDKELMAAKSQNDVAELFKNNPDYVKSLYRAFPDDTALVAHVFQLTQHPETRKLYAQSDSLFGDLGGLKKQFEDAFKNIKKNYPEFKEPKIMATFTGLENDIFVSDSLIIIALEAFVGPKAHYRPQQPNYILKRYSPEYIVPTIIRFLSNSYNKVDPADQTFQGDMIFFGKSLEFVKEMMPETPDSLIIGYPEADLLATWDAQNLIWAHIIDKNLLLNPNPHLKEKYFGERPTVAEIGPKCPGRIGQWVGWRIVKRYRTEKPNVTFKELMDNQNPAEILRESKYRGQTED